MIKSNLQHLCWKTYELMMGGAADQKLANGGGGVPRGTGLPPVCGGGGVKKKGAVRQLFSTPWSCLIPPAEEAVNRLKAGWPGGRTVRQPLLHFHIHRLFLLKQKV